MDSAIKRANDKLTFLSTDKDFLHQVHLREIALSDFTSAINDAKDEGEEKAKTTIAKNMLRRETPIQYIIEDTGLTESKIIEIQKTLWK